MSHDEHDAPDAHTVQEAQQAAVAAYWETARKRVRLSGLELFVGTQGAGLVQPPAWSFGSDPQEADSLLELVLAGRKTATASAQAPYLAQDVPVPVPGDLSIILDGNGRPRALIVTTDIQIVPFREVGEEHATAEGEGDLSLAHWRRVHERFLTEELAQVDASFGPDTAVVCERFRLLDPKPPRRTAGTREPSTV